MSSPPGEAGRSPAGEQLEWIDSIAKKVSQQYDLDPSDVVQELWVQWLAAVQPRLVETAEGDFVEMSTAFSQYLDKGESGKGQVLVTLGRWAADYARQETAVSAGASLGDGISEIGRRQSEDAYYYPRTKLRALLQGAAEDTDLARAWGKLPQFERDLLEARFLGDTPTPYGVLAERFEGDAAYLRKRVERALTRLQSALGAGVRAASGAAGRRVVSNEAAAVAVRRQWEG